MNMMYIAMYSFYHEPLKFGHLYWSLLSLTLCINRIGLGLVSSVFRIIVRVGYHAIVWVIRFPGGAGL